MSDKTTARGGLELWFDFGSTYSYLSVMRVEYLAAAAGVDLIWRPMLLGPIFKELGWQGSPFLEQKEKEAYMWKDMARQCRKYGLAWNKPSVFPRAALLPLRVVQACADESWIAAFCREVMVQNFVEDVDINAVGNVQKALSGLGVNAQDVFARAQTEDNKAALRAQTQRARELGVFGGPTFFAAGEMFWGNDRLEDALDHASRA